MHIYSSKPNPLIQGDTQAKTPVAVKEGFFQNQSVKAEKKKNSFKSILSKAQSIFRPGKKKVLNRTVKINSQNSLESLKTKLPKSLEEVDASLHTLQFLVQDKKLSHADKEILLARLEQLRYLKEAGPLSKLAYHKLWALKQQSFHLWIEANLPLLSQTKAKKLVDSYFSSNVLRFEKPEAKKDILENLNKANSEMIRLLADYGLIDSQKTSKDSLYKALAQFSEGLLSQEPKRVIEEELYFETDQHTVVKLNQSSTPLGECLPCSNVQTEKLTNAWKSELKTPEGEVVMRQFRHASLCAFGEANKAKREELSLQRAEELIMNIIDIQSIEEHIRSRKDSKTADFILPIVSNNLESADNLRGLAQNLLETERTQAMNERRHIREQTAALEQACKNKTLELELEGIGKVKIIPKLIAFNFGVNEFALKKGVTKAGKTWENARQTNQAAMEDFFGKDYLANLRQNIRPGGLVGEFLAQNQDAKKQAQVLSLAQQIVDLYSKESYKTAGTEPYKMVARVMLLSHLIGAKACTNCKSGKDRTSMAVAEAHYLALTLHKDGKLPEPDSILDDKQRRDLAQFVFGKSNYEIQAHNRGAKGYKLGGIAALNKRVVGEDNPLFNDLFEGLAYAI